MSAKIQSIQFSIFFFAIIHCAIRLRTVSEESAQARSAFVKAWRKVPKTKAEGIAISITFFHSGLDMELGIASSL